jgi:prepilin-type N-terminal cleavage/methylation domain-containing protein
MRSPTHFYSRRDRQHGVTLMELLIVVVVVGILASLATPTYERYVIRAQRAAGKSELMATASAMERCFARLNAYNDAGCTASAALPRTVAEGRYTLQAAVLTAGAFTLRAVPQGRQVNDTQCKTLTINQQNARGVTGGATETAQYCWAR